MTEEEMPERDDAPQPENGDDFTGEREVGDDELVLLKVRYKKPGASAEDPAAEVTRSLRPDSVQAGLAEASTDFRWAVAVASYAEIIKESPYADAEALPTIQQILSNEKGEKDDRAEFEALVDKSISLLGQ